ncbi:LysR family transcriptional regulator [Alteromonas halophila]|uniref:Transcriptional regulator n=1 Tax=Alteromonas halophila TaxID=516698 RepID=A0A918JLQ4_9ALTE|nr:LysR family transcriptional regulator [Alteromonas halophila]GGW88364.1 transcriptional regulator [Alteromonas halophila]
MAISYRNMLAFLRVAESSTFAEAAEKLHITQPALSSAIKKMEEQLGGKLFSRSTRRVQLTPEGQTLLPTARRLINDWDETLDDMQHLFSMRQGKLTIAAMPSFADSRLPLIMRMYHDRHHNIRLRILDVVMEAVIDAVLSGRAEIGFTFEPEVNEGLVFAPLFEDSFIVVTDTGHPLASQSSVSWSTCLKYPFIMMNRGSAVRNWTENRASEFGSLTIVAETGQLGSVGQLVAQGLGISVVPALCGPQMKARGLHCLTINDKPLVKQVGMIKASRRGLSVAAQALWTQCTKGI